MHRSARYGEGDQLVQSPPSLAAESPNGCAVRGEGKRHQEHETRHSKGCVRPVYNGGPGPPPNEALNEVEGLCEVVPGVIESEEPKGSPKANEIDPEDLSK